MIKVIGTIGCSKCNIIKSKLENKGIEFNYVLLNELTNEEQDEALDKAKDSGLSSFPIILRDDEVVKLEEVI
ncbi:MAG: glutaredoxin family protein [bacterium]